jgi:hypothetical protein
MISMSGLIQLLMLCVGLLGFLFSVDGWPVMVFVPLIWHWLED